MTQPRRNVAQFKRGQKCLKKIISPNLPWLGKIPETLCRKCYVRRSQSLAHTVVELKVGKTPSSFVMNVELLRFFLKKTIF